MNVTFEPIDVRANPEVPTLLLSALARLGRESAVSFAAVDEGKLGLVYLDGRLVRELGPGNYGFWTSQRLALRCSKCAARRSR